MSKSVVIVCTSAAFLGAHKTGLWLEEAASPYYLFTGAGYTVTLASPAGGAVPIDEGSITGGFLTESCKKFLADPVALGALSHTTKLSEMSFPDCCDSLYLAGGHGTCVDFHDNAALKSAIETMINAGKIVCADCHGPIALAQCKKTDGTPLLAGLACTGFNNSEEAAVQLTSAVPFLIETKFKELGGVYTSGADWNPHVVVAQVEGGGTLITGQNPQSSDAAAEAVLKAMQ